MRTFIAVDLSEEAKNCVGQLIDRLKSHGWGVRWSKPENVHITLRFLGEVPDKLLPQVFEAAEKAASRCAPFMLRLGGASGFGGKNPRVLFLEVYGETDSLKNLQRELEEELAGRGFGKEDRPFTPHLTLGRRKSGTLPADWHKLAVPEPLEWEVAELVVYASKLTREGPLYTPLARYDLSGEEKRPP